MIEVKGNIWEYKATVICITTNEIVKKDGSLVMGRGVAKQCLDRNPGVEFEFGSLITENGSKFQVLKTIDSLSLRLLAMFPVKQHWNQPAKLTIIQRSAQELGLIASQAQNAIFVLPRPGCGNGGLNWDEVKPVIEFLLPNNVHIISLPGG